MMSAAIAACLKRHPRQPVERGGGLAFGADEWRAAGPQLLASAPEDGRVLAHENAAMAKPDRVGGQLVQRHLERGAVACRIGQPFTQALPLRRDVQDEHSARKIINDDVGKIPQLPALRGGSRAADASPEG